MGDLFRSIMIHQREVSCGLQDYLRFILLSLVKNFLTRNEFHMFVMTENKEKYREFQGSYEKYN